MPILKANIYAHEVAGLSSAIAKILQDVAVDRLGFRSEETVVFIQYSQPTDYWYLNLIPKIATTDPAFHVSAYWVPTGTNPDISAAYFVFETRDALKLLLAQTYPGTTYPEFGDRCKVSVVQQL